MWRYYIYSHTRPDSGETFYIGRGLMYERSAYPRRAHSTKGRNAAWHSIVKRNGGQYRIDILQWCETKEEVLALEVEWIARIGRQPTGPLVNRTDGGDGSLGLKHGEDAKQKMKTKAQAHARKEWLRSDEFKAKRAARLVGVKLGAKPGFKHSAEAKRRMGEAHRGDRNHWSKAIVNIETGARYPCVAEAAAAEGIGKWALYKWLKGQRPNRTSLRYVA